jgi:hypothetical protein
MEVTMSVIWLEGRHIYVNTRTTQTVKVCDSANVRGRYDRYYRIDKDHALKQETLLEKLSQFESIESMEKWLLQDMKASREPRNEYPNSKLQADSVDEPSFGDESVDAEVQNEKLMTTGSVAEVFDLLSSDFYLVEHDEWTKEAACIVEESINKLVDAFVQDPYLHRVEQSLHVELCDILRQNPKLDARVSVGTLSVQTQLIHKEWPAIAARQSTHRGNIDIVVLSPQVLSCCKSLSAFRNGHIQPQIAIEMGLDYGIEHLANDALKLLANKLKFGYIVHFVRDRPRDWQVEKMILGIEHTLGIRTAYACITGNAAVSKKIGQSIVSGA